MDYRRKVIRDVIKSVGLHLGLVAWDAVEAPSEQGDSLSEKCLEGTFWLKAGDDAGAVPPEIPWARR